MNSLSTHVLDIQEGKPVAGLQIILEAQRGAGQWSEILRSVTNSDGRVGNLVPPNGEFRPGIYRITFETRQYFYSLGVKSLYPSISITFEKTKGDDRHFHIPLLLSAHGYSTYRGS